MKGISYSFLRAVCALVMGLLLVMFPEQAGNYLVITIGVVFMVPSLIGLIAYFTQEAEVRRRFPVEGVGSLLFGLWLVIMPGFFANLLTFVLGFILLMGGIQQIASLMAARRWTVVPWGFYLLPVLILVAGLVALLNPMGVQRTTFLILGISSLLYALIELLNWFKFMRLRPKQRAENVASPTPIDDIEDAEIIED
ncbi:MAG: HdeD family acid-resistance protein [Bacteroides sp.]